MSVLSLSFSFAVGQPGLQLVDAEVESFIRSATGVEATFQQLTSTKRLAFEAHTYLVASVCQSVEQKDETARRKMPHAEGTTRMEELRTSLRGVSISGELEPVSRRRFS